MTWVSASDEFPGDHLPYGAFTSPENPVRLGVAVGDHVLDLLAAADAGLLTSIDAEIAGASTLNPLIDAGPTTWRALRTELRHLVSLSLIHI